MDTILTFRKKTITTDDLTYIREVIAEYHHEGRTAISKRLCEAWDWRHNNGFLKAGVCRTLLLLLERNQLITLPERMRAKDPARRRKKVAASLDFPPPPPLTLPLRALPPIVIRQVRWTPEEKLFNGLIRQYHYLGYVHPVGEQLKFLVYAGGQLLACLAFSSAAYALDCRDRHIGWSREARESNRHLLAYNTRFLILPWVQVPHLASHILGRIARLLPGEWQKAYNHPIYWLETFVDTERFAGTCYKAANWIFLGLTSGRGKYNKSQCRQTSIKAMYGYPLHPHYRTRLCHG